MAVRYQNYYDTVNDPTDIEDVNWRAQTFTPATTHSIVFVRLYLSGSVILGGDLVVGIRATNAVTGKPEGPDLAVGTFETFQQWPAFAYKWCLIPFEVPCELTSGTKYAIVARGPSFSWPDYVRWKGNAGGTYAGGNGLGSANSGATWTDAPADDRYFEEWGALVIDATADRTIITDKVTLELIRNIEMMHGGHFLVAKDGKAKYESRNARYVAGP